MKRETSTEVDFIEDVVAVVKAGGLAMWPGIEITIWAEGVQPGDGLARLLEGLGPETHVIDPCAMLPGRLDANRESTEAQRRA